MLRAALGPGEEAEVLLGSSGVAGRVKRLARVVWCVPLGGEHAAGLRLDKPLS